MIGIDWGTSSFRAYRFDAAGTVREQTESACGITTVTDGDFAAVLRGQCGAWLDAGETRVLMSGMIGSRQGWQEAPYIPCPVDTDRLPQAIIRVPFPGAELRIIPGLSDRDPAGVPEVMRGEETQLMGLQADVTDADLVCLPGSHSKWVRMARGRVLGFATYLAGEAYAALRHATILGRTMVDAPPDAEAFRSGVERAGQPGHLLHHLFGVRSLAVTGALPGTSGPSYLSGLLIGTELRAAMPAGAHVHLVGSATLCTLYRDAIALCGGTSRIEAEGAAARGLARIGALAWS